MKMKYAIILAVLAVLAVFVIAAVASNGGDSTLSDSDGAYCPAEKSGAAQGSCSMTQKGMPAGHGAGMTGEDAKCGQCAMNLTGDAKAAHDAYMTKTADLRKDLSDTRAALNTELKKSPADKSQVMTLVDRVNTLQGRLYKETVDLYLTVSPSMADKPCADNPVACTMMMSNQCGMMAGGQKMSCGPGEACGMTGGHVGHMAMANPAEKQHGTHAKPAASKVVSATCPVMGSKIQDVSKAAGKSVYKGETYYFCCAGCKPKFDKDPSKYVN